MSNDLISREALKKTLDTIKQIGYDTENKPLFDYVELPDLIKVIDNAPTIPQTIITEFKGCDNCELERPQGKWIITAEDSEGIHRIQCPFCGYEKGSDFIDYITVTFEKLPPFCESCGAELRGEEE